MIPIPPGLCPVHHARAVEWRRVEYNPRCPSEWPGGGMLMDSRTSHDERTRRWDEKTAAQIDLIARICRRGDSPECGTAVEAVAA